MSNTKPYRVESIAEFHRMKGLPPPSHPLISVIDYSTIACVMESDIRNWNFSFFNISVKRGVGAKLRYGQQQYDFDEGVMFFVAPNQVFGVAPNNDSIEKRSGWMLLVHPDFLWNTALAKKIKQYEFFGYSTHEALFLSEKEEDTLNAIVQNIAHEYQANLDKFSQDIIVSQIETLLNYSERYYQRQFITRKISNHKVLESFENLLHDYFEQDDLDVKGLPSVQSIADSLHISSSYLSSLLKSQTGQNAQQHIHEKLIEKAKEKLSTTNLSVSEIAFGLGFEHSQSFSKLFKNKSGVSPLQFRSAFN
ncbi:helix-turn-helix domain-containing protein [Flavobacterium pallidum]|uniref:AraC family transcriptional regulator n=1 Tax=Flavobacterium pallidum TaxID=2172098 RepID=A0A2S1SIZ3_9FLAO|nr:response regulator transcription factor [Flavobacterium pallidum]AWI26317.1 AraC family transcriptional regulator [Flavobacterium pallidum]